MSIKHQPKQIQQFTDFDNTEVSQTSGLQQIDRSARESGQPGQPLLAQAERFSPGTNYFPDFLKIHRKAHQIIVQYTEQL